MHIQRKRNAVFSHYAKENSAFPTDEFAVHFYVWTNSNECRTEQAEKAQNKERTMYQERYGDISIPYVIRMPIKRCHKPTFPLVSLHFCCPPRAHSSGCLYYTHTSLALRDRGQLSPGGSVAPVLIGHCNGTKRSLACLQMHAHTGPYLGSLSHLNSAVINILMNICTGTLSRFFTSHSY